MAVIEGKFKRVRAKRKSKQLAGGASGSWDDGPAQQSADISYFQKFKNDYAAAVQNLDNASAALDAAESNLISVSSDVQTAGSQQDIDAYNAAMNRIIAAQATRDSAKNALQQAADFIAGVKSAFGLGALFPAIPWSLVAGIAAAAAFLYAAANAGNSVFNDWQIRSWNAENIARQNAGQAPLSGGPALADTSSAIGGLFGNVQGIAMYIAIGLIAWLFVSKA